MVVSLRGGDECIAFNLVGFDGGSKIMEVDLR